MIKIEIISFELRSTSGSLKGHQQPKEDSLTDITLLFLMFDSIEVYIKYYIRLYTVLYGHVLVLHVVS
jgi:hypothetical protein